ncbi:MAG TPA: AmmeMemoRadiSam system protein B [Vicinamibacteria bacterium]|nr:AmmeMemoRadiSam system protein B [Vicinamibacteria bacterium]
MTRVLPALRRNLDLMPSPAADRPGLLMRDPFRFAEAVLVIPSGLVPCLAFFNGRYERHQVAEALVRLSGDVRVGQLIDHLADTLSEAGFLEDEVFAGLRDERTRAFADAEARTAAHAGSAYPVQADTLRQVMARYVEEPDGGAPPADTLARGPLLGIAAPHVSPEGGWRSYQAAYRALGPEPARRTYAILGTSHYGEPDAFGLTRKPFLTPLGEAAVDHRLVDELVERGGAAVRVEDYCHSIEHSIEFQVVFLQHLFGPGVRILPILCGPFARSTQEGGLPDDDPGVERFLSALGEVAAREGRALTWVLGVDMAHMGRRYGDAFEARAEQGLMLEVAERDRARFERIAAGDARGFWELVREKGDELRWCGASPLYAFLKAVAPASARVARYEQWNIDDASVVSFAALAFHDRPAARI